MRVASVGTGAALVGSAILALVCRIAYRAPALDALAYTLLGAGLALFLAGVLANVRWSVAFLILAGVGGMFASAFVLVGRPDTRVGIPLALASLTWTLALVGSTMFSKASTFSPTGAPPGRGQMLK